MGRDMTAGAALVVAGGAFAIYSAIALPLGTLNRMGPGMVPMGLGMLLALFGMGVFLPALMRDEALPSADPRALIAILTSISVFSLLIGVAGLAPAVLATALVASLSMPGLRIGTILTLCTFLAVLTWFIFLFLLKLQIPLIAWSL